MSVCKSIRALVACTALLASACGAARPPQPAPEPRAERPRQDRIAVPEAVDAAARMQWEKTLALLPAGHPDRRDLRDRIAESYAAEFEEVADGDPEERLDLFERALDLHDPSDFRPGMVSAALVPMARWVIERYERRGDEALVLAGLRYLVLAEPRETGHRESYLELAEWSESVREAIPDDLERLSSVADVYERMVRLVPDREVVDHLAEILVRKHETLVSHLEGAEQLGDLGVPPFLWRAVMQEGGLAKEMIHIYFLAGDPASALGRLRNVSDMRGIGGEYLDLLEDIEEGRGQSENYFALASLLGPENPRAGLRACVLARARDRDDPRFPLCIGRFYEKLGHPECAADFYLEAADTAPTPQVLTQVMELMRVALFEVHRLEDDVETGRIGQASEDLVDRALGSAEGGALDEEDEDLIVAAASLLFAAGEVDFDDGRIRTAFRRFRRSHEVLPNVLSLVKLADIHRNKGRYEKAVEVLDLALGLDEGAGMSSGYWRAVVLERRADCRVAMTGDEGAGREDYEVALSEIDQARFSRDDAPEAAIRQGVIQDRLGDREASEESFRLAIRLDPDRRSTYAELISYLVTRERLEDAGDFYRLAYNQDQIEEMWKIYYSLWVEGLALRVGGTFDLARGYLEQSDGDSWQCQLARYFTGRIDYDALLSRAENAGQRVEADFYSAVRLLAEGEGAEARARLERVVASNLMGFFEYKMALDLLRDVDE